MLVRCGGFLRAVLIFPPSIEAAKMNIGAETVALISV
jgi:hypothetical protein